MLGNNITFFHIVAVGLINGPQTDFTFLRSSVKMLGFFFLLLSSLGETCLLNFRIFFSLFCCCALWPFSFLCILYFHWKCCIRNTHNWHLIVSSSFSLESVWPGLVQGCKVPHGVGVDLLDNFFRVRPSPTVWISPFL